MGTARVVEEELRYKFLYEGRPALGYNKGSLEWVTSTCRARTSTRCTRPAARAAGSRLRPNPSCSMASTIVNQSG